MLSALAPCVMHHPDMKHSKMEDFTMKPVSVYCAVGICARCRVTFSLKYLAIMSLT
jgi:hypothetical protein